METKLAWDVEVLASIRMRHGETNGGRCTASFSQGEAKKKRNLSSKAARSSVISGGRQTKIEKNKSGGECATTFSRTADSKQG